MNIEHWRRQRSSRFWGNILPMVKYVFNSGLMLVLGGGLIVFFMYYAKLLNDLPHDFPLVGVATVVLFLFTIVTPIRTYIEKADLVFLMPQPVELQAFFRPALRNAMVAKCAAMIIPWVFLWPIYRELEGIEGLSLFFMILAFLWVIQIVHVYSRWMELKLSLHHHRRILTAFRLGFTLFIYYVLFGQGLLTSALLLLLFIAIVRISFRVLPRHLVAWEELIWREKKFRANMYRFINQFVDAPILIEGERRISWFSQWLGEVATKLYPFQASSVYPSLYTKKLIRGEAFGILIRQWLMVALVICLLRSPIVGYFVLAGGIFMSGIQLYSFVKQMLEKHIWEPFSTNFQVPISAVCGVAFAFHLFWMVTLSVLFLVQFPSWTTIMIAAGGMFGSYIYFIFLLKLKRK